uniref:non-specific serine/threonine protein kinase n=1 Tax=Cacopsylla melanoneura TaxID=428564 RepID=A0A8D8UZT1_9HEMI
MPDELSPSNQKNLLSKSSISIYEKTQQQLQNDKKWQHETSLGKRVALYKIQNELGRGNFSTVKMAIHEVTKERVAIKILDKTKLTPKARKMLSREIISMETVYHPNIIRLYEVLETFGKIFLVVEYASGGELYNKITTEGKISEDGAKIYFLQILSAVKHLHDRDIIHRDIKAENVFLSVRGIVKLGDLGFSTKLSQGSQERLRTFCGSPPYAAPELFRDESYVGCKVDVWALGVLIYFMVTAQMPFPGENLNTLKKSILLGVITFPSSLSLTCRSLIRGLLCQDPEARFNLEQIYNSSWLQNVNLNSISIAKANEWSMTPRAPAEATTVIEKTARERLVKLGISETMLQEEKDKGSKSSAIATYRMVVHRLENNAAYPQPVVAQTVKTQKPAKSRLCRIL